MYLIREQYDKAEQILHVALKMAQDLQDEDGITYVYDVLANLAFQTRQFGKAKKLFTSVLQRLIAKGEPEDSNKVVDISLKIAKIFEETKEFGKAEQGFKFCIETLDNKLNTDDQDTLALWGMSMDWYARFLLDRNKKQEALVCFRKAYEMCVKVNGVVHEQTVVLLNDLGTVASLIGDHESALNYLEKARDIGMSLPEMKDLPAIYINLGQLYLIREMYKESKLACQQGLKLAKQYGDDISVTEANECFNKISSVLKAKEVNKDLPQVPHVAVNQ
ncbi:hypothetical protein RUM43_008606 [Polyplax serrata]|uniref:Uncharacterized protein n=1 Tax=Polyplax serrata TaxID=468196 RepID=A0AAN8PG67_POLSC